LKRSPRKTAEYSRRQVITSGALIDWPKRRKGELQAVIIQSSSHPGRRLDQRKIFIRALRFEALITRTQSGVYKWPDIHGIGGNKSNTATKCYLRDHQILAEAALHLTRLLALRTLNEQTHGINLLPTRMAQQYGVPGMNLGQYNNYPG
jgi:hypothetical protein